MDGGRNLVRITVVVSGCCYSPTAEEAIDPQPSVDLAQSRSSPAQRRTLNAVIQRQRGPPVSIAGRGHFPLECAVAGLPIAGGAATILVPTSLSNRWNSGESLMMVPAAARRRSTASGGSTKEVGC